MLRIKDYTTKVGSGVTPRGGAETYLDEGIPLFRSQNVTNDGFLMDDIAFISEEVDESMKGTRVKPGDVLLNITGASIGRCFYTSDDFERGNVNQHVCIIRPKKNKVKPDYLHYCIISDKGQQQIDLTQTGANREGLAVEDIKGFMFDIPSLPVQQRIVDYLNKKLAEINKRITSLAKQQDAYARLKKSIIHQAVTRGLNPDISLKDSGIEWIGMIPEHWKIYRFKDVYNKSNVGESIEKEYCTDNEADYLFYTAGIIPIHTDLEEFPQWKYTNKNDLLLARNGTPYVYLPILNSVYSDHIIRVDIKKGFCKEYVRFCLQQAISTEVIDSVSIPTWSISVWNKQLMSFPPLSEQQSIAAYLDEKCAKIDAAIENIGKQIDASKRLKRALINEVITGQRAV